MAVLKRYYDLARRKARQPIFERWLKPDGSVAEQIGRGYGSWVVPVQALPDGGLCYCAGVGEDTQLDEGLVSRGQAVFSFDPTPRAIEHMAQVAERCPEIEFSPVGLWDTDTTLRFYAPRDETHVSHSALNLQRTSTWFDAPVERLSTVMARYGHDHIDLLKLDIEGAEHAVIADMLRSRIRPTVLCVEFDQPAPLRKVIATSRALIEAGYHPIRLRDWDVTWRLR
jgi:FkbM family methyltransferase